MNKKRILGIIILVVGVSLVVSSFYIKSRVSSGREEIAQAEKTVKRGKQLFSLNPTTKEIGKGLTDSADRKIQEGSAKADRYEIIALWFQISGGVFIVVGGYLIFVRRKEE
jgi:hypothetical protein